MAVHTLSITQCIKLYDGFAYKRPPLSGSLPKGSSVEFNRFANRHSAKSSLRALWSTFRRACVHCGKFVKTSQLKSIPLLALESQRILSLLETVEKI